MKSKKLLIAIVGATVFAMTAALATPPPIPNPTNANTMPCKDGEPAAPWWADFVDHLGEALATLAAGGLGFGVAAFTESRAWKRRKAEQIRSEQLSKLLLAARKIQMCRTRLGRYRSQLVAIGSETGDKSVLRASALAEARALFQFLSERLGEVELDQLDLRALQIGSPAIIAVSTSTENIRQIVSQLEPATRTNQFDEGKMAAAISIDIPIDPLTAVVLNSLETG